MKLTRRNFLGLSATAAFSLFSPLELIALEKEKFVTDPEILSFYETLVEKLKNRSLEFYSPDTFNNFLSVFLEVKKYIDENKLVENNFFILDELPDDLRNRLYSASERHVISVSRPDLFEDVVFPESYIEKNKIEKSNIASIVNKSKVVLFGEVHATMQSHNMEMNLIKNKLGNFVYTDENLQIHNAVHIKDYMGGRDESIDRTVNGMDGDVDAWFVSEKIINFLKELRRMEIPVMPAGSSLDLQKKLNSGFDRKNLISHLSAIRESVFARQINYAVKKGYDVLGSFGDMHLRKHALPKKLAHYGINPLIISSADFPLEIFSAAMKISKGDDIFFRRNGSIIYY